MHSQTCNLTLFADVSAQIFPLLLKLSFLLNIDDKLVSIELFNLSDALIFIEKKFKVFFDAIELFHYFISKVTFALFISFLELYHHSLGDGLKLIDGAWLDVVKG